MAINETSLDTLCAALTYAMGVDKSEISAKANEALVKYVDEAFDGEKADRVFMYNPDAIAQWVHEKYKNILTNAIKRTDIEIPFATVMPSCTPVCFATMYTGTQPEVHGIREYKKPVLSVETIFDTLIKAGKKPVIIAESNCSIAKIFLERHMDYFIFDTIEEVNAKAAEIIIKDEYDFIVVYNGNYDALMHKFAPEGIEALAELKANAEAYAMFDSLIQTHWKKHNSLVGFAMDHGCHEIDNNCGAHGLSMPEDINIVHLYKGYKGE